MTELEIDDLQSLLDNVPAPLEPLDVSMLDGFLCGLLVQPKAVPVSAWMPHVTDVDGHALPRGFDATRLHALVRRRHAELNDAIAHRQWFDPWVFELASESEDEPRPSQQGRPQVDDKRRTPPAGDEETSGGRAFPHEGEVPSAVDAVYPWVAGFATALELFPDLMAAGSPALTEPLALLYRHLDADDLEDADELLEEIDSLEPAADLDEAVEDLVRATLLLADVGRPASPAARGATGASRRSHGPRRTPASRR